MSLQARIVSAHFDSHQRVISAVRLTSLGLSALIIIGLPSRRELRRDRRSHPTDDFRRIRLSGHLYTTQMLDAPRAAGLTPLPKKRAWIYFSQACQSKLHSVEPSPHRYASGDLAVVTMLTWL
jgi:hypothetical protein